MLSETDNSDNPDTSVEGKNFFVHLISSAVICKDPENEMSGGLSPS